MDRRGAFLFRLRVWGCLLDRLQQLSSGSGLFASVQAEKVTDDLAVSFTQLGLGEPAPDEPGRIRMDPDRLKAHFHQVREAMRALVDGHREEAGLEPLPRLVLPSVPERWEDIE